jgi:hypothetical protein
VNQRPNHFKIYIPCRTAIVLCPYEHAHPHLVKNKNAILRMPEVTERQLDQIKKINAAAGVKF